MVEWHLERATPADRESIESLFDEMMETIYGIGAMRIRPVMGPLDRFWRESGDWICVARIGEQVVGFLSMEVHKEGEDYLYLDDFCVHGPFRGWGIGSALMKRAREYAQNRGLQAIYLHVEKENRRAGAWYKRLGFQTVREQGSRLLLRNDLLNDV